MQRTRLPIGSVFGIVSVTTLIAVELLAAVGAFAWALAGLFDLSDLASYILATIVGIPSLVVVGKVTQLAIDSERSMVKAEDRET